MNLRVREIRLERQLTQRQAADILGISLERYRRIEQGRRRRIPLSLACALADCFQVSLDELAGRIREKEDHA